MNPPKLDGIARAVINLKEVRNRIVLLLILMLYSYYILKHK